MDPKKYLSAIIVCLLILLAAGVIYAPVGNYGYILYDDMSSIYDPFLTQGLSLDKLGRAFYDPPAHLPYQVPIPTVVRLVLWEMFNDDLGKHHLFSLGMHLLCALSLFLLLRSMTGRTAASGFCALLVTVHPLNVEAVSWLAGFNGLLEALFLIITLACYGRYVRRPSRPGYLLVFIPFILGLLSKPTMVILPFLMVLYDVWPAGRFGASVTNIKKNGPDSGRGFVIAEKIPFLMLIPVYLMAGNLIAAGQWWRTRTAPFSFHPGAVVDFVRHLGKIIYPVGLTVCRPDPPETPLAPVMGLGLAALVISGLLLWKARNRGYLITGWFWFLIAAAPVAVMLFVSGRPVEDHHLYIPLIGVFIMMAFGLSDFLAPFRNGRGLFLITASVITIALTAVSVSQVKHWENSLTVFQQALSVHPDNKKARVNLGDACLEKGRVEEAERHYRRFLDIAPDSALGHTKLAQSLALLGRPEDARRHLETALRLSPDYVPALHGLADLLAGLGKTDQAIALYRRALEINAGLFQTHNNLALALYDQGHFQEALAHLDQAIRLKPDYRTAIENRRVILYFGDTILNADKLSMVSPD